ncbi:MAG: secretion system protein [Actinobacteria bacterium]|nr:MAG: secretion system protein [Actinomycetota bacterium]
MVMWAALAVGAGLSALVVGLLSRARDRQEELARILELPFGEKDLPVEVAEARAAFIDPGVELVQGALEKMNLQARLAADLERARIPIRPGEFVIVAAVSGLLGGALAMLLTGRTFIAVVAGVLMPWIAWRVVKIKVSRRSQAFERQLPDALSLIAGSLEAGHTFLRAVEMMVEESEPPLSQEFERVLSETRLGDPLMDALDRMNMRLEIADLAWVIQALRIQQTVGGKLADLLTTLAEFMRQREEIRREVRVLTAEGRLSGNILGALPLFFMLIMQVLNPSWMTPMFHGWGPMVLAASAVSVMIGVALIRKMARVDV